jgi:hypothetical protein
MTYTLTSEPNMVQRDKDGAFIPFDNDNVDYQDFLAWLKEGNEPKPYQKPTPPIEQPPPPDIQEVNAQVQDIETRLSALEGEMKLLKARE